MQSVSKWFPRMLILCAVVMSFTLPVINCGPGTSSEQTDGSTDETSPEVVTDAKTDASTAEKAPADEPVVTEKASEPAPDKSTGGDEPTATEPNPTEPNPTEPNPTEQSNNETTPEQSNNETTPENSAGLTLTGQVNDFTTRKPIEGVKVCQIEPAGGPCATTDAKGEYTLSGIAEKQNLLFSMEKTGYVRVIQGIGMGQATRLSANLLPTAALPLFAAAVGVQVKPGTGFVVITPYGPEGFAAGITMKTTATGAQGPFFLGTNGQPDPKLQRTTAAGYAFFVNVPVGQQTITTTGSGGQSCTALRVWPGSKDDEFLVKVEADTMSYFGVDCERKLKFVGNISNFTNRQPIQDVKVCLTKPTGTGVACAMTDASGNHTLTGVPEKKELLFSFEKAGFTKVVLGMSIGQPSTISPGMIPSSLIPLMAGAAGVQIKPGTGIVVMTAINRLAGFATDISMKLTASGAQGPLYLGATGQPDLTLKGTSSIGLAFYVNVPPGTQVVTATGNHNQTCTTYRGWRGQKDNESRVQVEADAMTYFTVLCDRARTQKLGESCYQSDPQKPEYGDCVQDHSCVSGKCVAASAHFASCNNVQGCVTGDSCIGLKSPARYCLKDCVPTNPECPTGFECITLNTSRGACIQPCTADADCKDYGTVCETNNSGGTQKYCR